MGIANIDKTKYATIAMPAAFFHVNSRKKRIAIAERAAAHAINANPRDQYRLYAKVGYQLVW